MDDIFAERVYKKVAEWQVSKSVATASEVCEMIADYAEFLKDLEAAADGDK